MRQRLGSAAAVAAALVVLSACGGGSDAAPPQAAVVPVVADTDTSQVEQNPFAWSQVPYAVYVEAAEQLAIRPDVLIPSGEFLASLGEICTTPTGGYTDLRAQQVASSDTETGDQTTAQYLRDETSLRITLACPQRMPDWISVPEIESVDDLAAEEAAAAEEFSTDEQYELAPTSDADFAESSYSTPVQPSGYSERTGDTSAVQ
ncbi:MAG: hypothetical protein ACT4P1_03315 [Sporichthyaceae bacterium]